MRAYILSIGSELIQGHLTDTNATFLAQELAALGIDLLHVVQVGDDLERLTGKLREAALAADLVVCTGGVGPTDDDLTREAVAALAGETPEVDSELLAAIRRFFAGRGLAMPERNAKQAWRIPSAEILPNPVGTAPGWFVRVDRSLVVAMPGVPREMRRMWTEQVVPRLAPSLPGRVARSINFRTLGIGESAAAELLGELTRLERPYVGTYAKDDGVHVRVTAMADSEAAALAMLTPSADEVRRRLNRWLYAEDDRPLPVVIADRLRQRKLSVGIVEASGGGRFGALLLGETAAEQVVRGALARPRDGEQTAMALAAEARTRFEAAIGVGIDVAAAPTDLGLVEGVVTVAVAGHGLTIEERFPIRAAFPEVQRRAALHAADVLLRSLGRAE